MSFRFFRLSSEPMFDRPWNRPPVHPDQVNAQGICDLLGVPAEIDGESIFASYVYPCALEVCTDNELRVSHPQNLSDPKLVELFGGRSYSEGSFQPALRAMLEEFPPPWQRGLIDFQTAMACLLVADFVTVKRLSFITPSVRLANDTLLFDSDQHSVDLPPLERQRVVIDYGPGTNSRFIIQEHVEALIQERPFIYVPVTRGSFISIFMAMVAATLMPREALDSYIRSGFFVQREDGILAASSDLAHAWPGVVDLVLCSGLQDVDKHALRAGIVNALTLLRPDGILLIRSQRIRDPEDSSTVDDMLEIAYEAGFSKESARFFDSIAGIKKQMPTMTALLRKS